MKILDRLKFLFTGSTQRESKASSVGPLIVMTDNGRPVSKKRNSDDFAKDGYQKTVIAYSCINIIADAIASLEWKLYDSKRATDRNEITDHEILDLLDKPNPMQCGEAFMKSYIAYLMIAGDSYLEGVGADGRSAPKELWTHRPSRMSVIPGAFGLPSGYEFKIGSNKKIFEVDPITGKSAISQLSLFNPLSDWYGQSPLEAASTKIDEIRGLDLWNLSLINNSGRPCGAFIQKDNTILTDEQKNEMKEQIDEIMTGGRNAGRPLLLNGMEWKEMSLSPKDMDFVLARTTSKEDVALAFGIPGQMVGIQGSQKFKNMEEAKLNFWTGTAIPLAKLVRGTFNNWLAPSFGDNLFLDYNENAIDALEPLRAKKWAKAQSSDFLTTNEKRELIGKGNYEPTNDPGDKILVGQSMVPLEFAVSIEEAEEEIEEEDDENEETEEDGKSKNNTFIEGKIFNLTSESEKRKAWKSALRKRMIFERRLNSQVIAAFTKERKNITSNLKGVDIGLMSLVIDESIKQTSESFRKVLVSNIRMTAVSFGSDIFKLSKFQEIADVETKVSEDDFEKFISLFVETEATEAIKFINNTTRKRIRKAISFGIEEGENEEEITRRIEKTHKEMSRTRARRIARTEVHTASNTGSRKAAKALGVTLQKEWVSDLQLTARGNNPDDTTDHIHMNGIKVGLEEKFEVESKDGIDLMDGPGDSNAPIDQRANCKCTQIYQAKR